MRQAEDNKPFIVQEEKAYRERKKCCFVKYIVLVME